MTIGTTASEPVDEEHLDGLRRAGLPVVQRRSFLHPASPLATEVSPSTAGEWSTEQLMVSSWASSTIAAYQASWQRFMGWAAIRGYVEPLNAEPRDLADYVTYLTNRGLSIAYIRRELAGIRHHFITNGHHDPPTDHRGVKIVVAGVARIRGAAQREAVPLMYDDVRRIVNGLAIVQNRTPKHPTVQRDRALIALGWAIAQRGSQLVALNVEDLTFTDDGLLVRIAKSKTDQERRGATVAVPWSQHETSCPVRMTMILARARKTGALFRHLDRHGRHRGRLSVEGVTTIVRRHVKNVLQLDPTGYSSHSLRAGFVTEARRRRVPDAIIMRQTKHTSAATLHTYDRPIDLLDDTIEAVGEWW